MANTIDQIVDKIFARALLALRENAITARLVNTDFAAEVAQQGDTVNVTVPSAASVEDVVPGPTPPAGGDSAPTTVPIELNRWRKSDMHVTDKEAREVALGLRDTQLTEHIRKLANDVDNFVLGLYTGVYGFAGTAGTTPFGADVSVATEARKILNKQLAPMDPRRMLIDPDAEGNALGLRAFQDASFRGDTGGIRRGDIGEKLGFLWAMNQNIPTHTRNALGAGALTVNGVHAIGVDTVSIAKAAGASWEAKKGDVIRFAGDEQTYVVRADTTVVHTANTAVPISPALKVATAGGEAVTPEDTHVVNIAFHRDAFALATRTLGPADGFLGGNMMRSAVDPVSGLTLTLEVSREYARTKYQWRILYGASLVRAELATRVAG